MSSPREISVRILSKLGLDTSGAEQEAQRFAQKLPQIMRSASVPTGVQQTFADRPAETPWTAEHWARVQQAAQRYQAESARTLRELNRPEPVASVSPGRPVSERAQQLLSERLGPHISHVRQQREVLRVIHEQRQAYRELRDEVGRLEEAANRLNKTERQQADATIRQKRQEAAEQGRLVRALESAHQVGRLQESGGAFGQFGQSLSGLSFGQAIAGGGIGAVLGTAGRMAMAHPMISIPAILAGATLWAEGKADEMSRYSEDIEQAFANTGRRSGMPLSLRRAFQQRPGRVNPEFAELGFSGEDLARMVQAYPVPTTPGMFSGAIGAQARFARAYGFGDQPEMIAGLGMRATQLGLAEPQQQVNFWNMMAAAVEKGLVHGVDASEQVRSLLALTEQVAAHTGTVSREQFAGIAALQSLLSGGESRFFKGERGAAEVSNLMNSFTQPETVAKRRFLMNTVLGQFGGRAPTAEELGMGGYEAQAYGQMTQIQQLNVVIQRLVEFMANPQADPRVRGLMSTMARDLGDMGGVSGQQLAMQAFFGNMEEGKLLRMQGALASAVEDLPGMKGKTKDMAPAELLGMLFKRAPEQAKHLLQGQAPRAELTDVERRRFVQRTYEEQFSEAIAQATGEFREGVKEFKSGVTEWVTAATGRTIDQLNAGRAQRLSEETGVPPAALRRYMEEQGKTGRVLTDAELREAADQLKSGKSADDIRLMDERQRVDDILNQSIFGRMAKKVVPRGLFKQRPPSQAGGRSRGEIEADLQQSEYESREQIRHMEEMLDQGPEDPYGRLRKRMSWSPSGMGVGLEMTVTVTGRIELVGDSLPDGVSLSPHILVPLLERQIREQFETEGRMQPSRPALMRPTV